MKGLNRTLKIAKFFKVIYNILFVCTIIATSFSFIILIILLCSNKNLDSFDKILSNSDLTYEQLFGMYLSDLIVLGSNIYLVWKKYSLCNNICKTKMPFTYDVVKNMRSLGKMCIIIGIPVYIAAAIVSGLTKCEMTFINGEAVATGIFYLLLSCPFEYGAEILLIKNNMRNGDNIDVED